MPPVAIRRAEPSDHPELASLLDRYFREWSIPGHDSSDLLRTELDRPALGFYVVEQHDHLVACALCRPCPSIRGAAECKRLFVAPEVRGLGIATALMQRLEDEAAAAGYASMYLDTRDDFGIAIAFYGHHGYLPVSRYNDNSQATLFFRKQLL